MNAIETVELTKSYGKQRGISNVTMTVEEGELFGFIGPNGAGKSTTIRSLLGLIFPTSGSARILGMDVAHQGKEIARQVGYLPSEVDYYEKMTVAELLAYSARFYGASEVGRIEELAGLFEVELKRNISDLSLGNKKKISILQCLLHRPKLLILDEPTNGLDPLMQARFYDLLERENRGGTTIFFSSHVLGEVQRICKRVAIIKEGTIIALEDIDALRSKHLSRVRVEFRERLAPGELSLPGLVEAEAKDGSVTLLYSGEINPLLATLARHPIEKLSIEEPSLEEVFMHYYEAQS